MDLTDNGQGGTRPGQQCGDFLQAELLEVEQQCRPPHLGAKLCDRVEDLLVHLLRLDLLRR